MGPSAIRARSSCAATTSTNGCHRTAGVAVEVSAEEQDGQVEAVDDRGEALDLAAARQGECHGEGGDAGSEESGEHRQDHDADVDAVADGDGDGDGDGVEDEHGSDVREGRTGEEGEAGGRSDTEAFHQPGLQLEQDGEARPDARREGEESQDPGQELVERGLYRAYLLEEQMRAIFAAKDDHGERLLAGCLAWAKRSQLPALVELARTIEHYKPLIVNTLRHGLSNARSEATHVHLRALTRRAQGSTAPKRSSPWPCSPEAAAARPSPAGLPDQNRTHIRFRHPPKRR
jgi:hypothetical protein